jgi:hypothetical protein
MTEGHRKKRDHDTEIIGDSCKESIKSANVGIKSSDVLEFKVVMVLDETTGPYFHLVEQLILAVPGGVSVPGIFCPDLFTHQQ